MAAERGPNFAGHYTVAVWGCGTTCQSFAIINALTGDVAMGPFPLSVGASYRLDSEVFIADPPESWREAFGDDGALEALGGQARAQYFRWNGDQLLPLACLPIGKEARC